MVVQTTSQGLDKAIVSLRAETLKALQRTRESFSTESSGLASRIRTVKILVIVTFGAAMVAAVAAVMTFLK